MKLLLTVFVLFYISMLSGQTYTSYFTGNPMDTVVVAGGGICMMGGASEHDEAMRWFLRRCEGGDVLVLRASGSNGYNAYMYNQLGVDIHSVETIVCHSVGASLEPYLHQKIQQAEGIWFAGGDQWDYISYWRNTAIDSLINQAIEERNIVIGGTSAGMAILGGYYFTARNGTVTSSTALGNPYHSKVTVDSASFLKATYLHDVITDTHYDNPDRKGRQVTFLARIMTDWGLDAKGIACDEYTAVCIDTHGIANVYGNYPQNDDNAWFIQTNCELDLRVPETCVSGSPLNWNLNATALKVYNIKGTNAGTNSFDLNDWAKGTGGEWHNWYVTNGVFDSSESDRVHCTPSGVEITDAPDEPISVYPNPYRSGSLMITHPEATPNEILLVDTNGKVLLKVSNAQASQTTLDPLPLTPGVYVLIISNKDKITTQKLVVIR